MLGSADKQAGFALAALLAEDRELRRAGPGLTSEVRDACAAALLAPADESREQKARRVADWLALLRPPLGTAALALPGSVRRVLATVSKPPLRGQLLADVMPGRHEFVAEPLLLANLLRAARRCARDELP